MKHSHIKNLVLFAILVALASVFGWLESMLPNPLEAIAPGLKLGLANIVVLIALYRLGAGAAASVSLLRVLLTAFTFGSLSSLMFSLTGAVLSLLIMILLKSLRLFSPIGISTAGGVAHNLGQIAVACLTLGQNLIYYLPFLLLCGIFSGIFIGILGALILKRLPTQRES